jgi:hypothetical protein
MKFFGKRKPSESNFDTGNFIEVPNNWGEGDGTPLIVEVQPDLEKIFSDPNPQPPQRLTERNRKYWESLTLEHMRVTLAMAYLGHPDSHVREETIKFVKDIDALGVMQEFVDLLADPIPSVRKSAAIVIWEKNRWEFTVEALCDEIRGYSTMGPVRTTAGLTLGDTKAIGALEFLVEEAPDENARKEIKEFIQRLLQERISRGDTNLVNILEKFPLDEPAGEDIAELSDNLVVNADTRIDDIIQILNGYCQDQSIPFEERKEKTKEIGRALYEKGGNDLMLKVHDLLQAQQSRPGAARLIESWWDGIGYWRG